MKPLLKIENISKKYPNSKKYALFNFDLDIFPSEIIAIVGKSGSGKSTFLRCVNGLTEASNGNIYFKQRDTKSMSSKEYRKYRTNIGFIFQNYNLQDRISVLDNVLTGLLGQRNPLMTTFGLWSKQDKEKAKSILFEMGLSQHVQKRADQLSGGEKQRVSIARALIQDPKIILADEPVASLDPPTAKKILDDLKTKCKKRKIAVVINLHDIEMALKYSDRIIGLRNGEKVWDSPSSEATKESFKQIYQKA